MNRVTGLGGIFFKAQDPEAMLAWYKAHLGVEVIDGMCVNFEWRDARDTTRRGQTLLAPFPADTDYFAPSTEPFMVNLRVDDLDAVLAALRAEGVTVEDEVQDNEFGRFGWIMDPEGRRLELWQPPAE